VSSAKPKLCVDTTCVLTKGISPRRRQQLAAIIYPISMDHMMPRINHTQTNISRANSDARLISGQRYQPSSTQMEMNRMSMTPHTDRMFDELPGKESASPRGRQQERRLSWYEGGETLPTLTSNDFQEWKGKSTSSDDSFKEVSGGVGKYDHVGTIPRLIP
jgi:hypothetical protein